MLQQAGNTLRVSESVCVLFQILMLLQSSQNGRQRSGSGADVSLSLQSCEQRRISSASLLCLSGAGSPPPGGVAALLHPPELLLLTRFCKVKVEFDQLRGVDGALKNGKMNMRMEKISVKIK